MTRPLRLELERATIAGMNYGYACFWDTALLPWAMFQERDDAIDYASHVVQKKRDAGVAGARMRVVFKPNDEPFEPEPVWDSARFLP